MSDAAHDAILNDSLGSSDLIITRNIYNFISKRKGKEFKTSEIFHYLSEKEIDVKNRKTEILNHLEYLVGLGFLTYTLHGFKVSYERW